MHANELHAVATVAVGEVARVLAGQCVVLPPACEADDVLPTEVYEARVNLSPHVLLWDWDRFEAAVRQAAQHLAMHCWERGLRGFVRKPLEGPAGHYYARVEDTVTGVTVAACRDPMADQVVLMAWIVVID